MHIVEVGQRKFDTCLINTSPLSMEQVKRKKFKMLAFWSQLVSNSNRWFICDRLDGRDLASFDLSYINFGFCLINIHTCELILDSILHKFLREK